ncbi:MAG: hypothetical protein Q4E42_01395 [Phascolarctobacterium sp.]|nr:hypothetical protein [Phascolarctobacterium sp.]
MVTSIVKKAICLALLCSAVNVSGAELANMELDKHKIILMGETMENGFHHDFLLRVDRESVPYPVTLDVDGGYWPQMKIIQLKKDEKQLFFSTRQGGDNATTEYRIFAHCKDKLTPILSQTESFGLIQDVTLDEKKLNVKLIDGTKQTIPLADKIWDKISNYYNRGYEPNFQGFLSMVPYDCDKDGVDELFACQRIELNNTELGYVAARLNLQKDDSWKMNHYVLQMPSIPNEKDKLNQGVETIIYEIYPERIYIERANGAYPKFYTKDKVLANKINGYFEKEYAADLEKLFSQNASMGFEVVLAYEKILSLRFIGGANRYNHFLHVDPVNGNIITLDKVFNTNSAFLKRMSELSPSKHKYTKKDLDNWFMKDVNLSIVLDENGKQRAEQFKLGSFEEFINPKNTILQKNEKKDENKDSKKDAKASVKKDETDKEDAVDAKKDVDVKKTKKVKSKNGEKNTKQKA